ncbi:MAG: beta-ketoacyl-ACP synthase III [Bacteroidia bacterium]
MNCSQIAGVGHYVPKNIVTNDDLAKLMPTTDEWITERTGIKERRYFTEGEDTVTSMGAAASRMALERAGVDVKDVELIVFATTTSEYYFPGSGVLLQRELGLPGIPAMDIKMQCSGFIYALSIADQFIKTGMYKTALVVGSEIQSNAVEHSERGRNMAVIFADGAGAVVLKKGESINHSLLSTHLHSDGTHAEELYMRHPGSLLKKRLTPEMIINGEVLPHMNGQLVFKNAIIRFMEVIEEALKKNNYTKEDIDLLIPHQANLRISEYIRSKLEMPESKVFNNIMRYGNTTTASIPIALSEAWAEGKVKAGNLICLAAFGSGFTWASALIKW